MLSLHIYILIFLHKYIFWTILPPWGESSGTSHSSSFHHLGSSSYLLREEQLDAVRFASRGLSGAYWPAPAINRGARVGRKAGTGIGAYAASRGTAL